MIDIYHLACGQPAFSYDHWPEAGERIRSKHARKLDGSPIAEGSPMICCSCGQRIIFTTLELAPPPLRVYDMTNTADMQELYGTEGVSDYA